MSTLTSRQAIIAGAGIAVTVLMAVLILSSLTSIRAQEQAEYVPQFTADGELMLPPEGIWREWPYIGTPLTPNALNDGEAPFPEFHSVYIDPVSWEHWRETGEFRDGTVLAKELVSVISTDANPDGSTVALIRKPISVRFGIYSSILCHFPQGIL